MAIQRGRSTKIRRPSGMNITPMMDMFTIMVVFLLKQFSAEGNILTNAEDLVLPNSISDKKPKEVNLQIEVTNDMVLVEHDPVVPTKEVRNISEEKVKQVIPKLKESLLKYYAEEKKLVKMGAKNKVEGNVIVQIDKNMEFDVMYKVMRTCGEVGYNNMRFAVMQRET